MSARKTQVILGLAVFLTAASVCSRAQEKPPKLLTPEQGREEYAYTIGVQAYIYGYPLVEMYRVRYARVFDPVNKNPAQLNQFFHLRNLIDHTARTVVGPNNDTLYSSAWLDLAKEPIVLDIPDTKGRYYVMHFMDFYTNQFAYVGKRATGTKPGSFAITGPGWKGTLPEGVKRIESPTNAVWILGRTLVDGKDDLPAVHALQDQYILSPLSSWGKKEKPKPPAPPALPAYDLAEPLKFFELLNVALRENPPPAREAALMSLFGQIGLGPEKMFKVSELDPPTAKGLRRAIEQGQQIVASTKLRGKPINGWAPPQAHHGKFGGDYLYRASVAKFALAALTPDEAYNFIFGLEDSQPLNGTRKHMLRFEKGQMPPVDAFWSVTMYEAPDGFLVDNPIQRYSIGDRTKGLRYGEDGSLELYLQHESPGKDKESNWLPAPKGNFALALRCYLPRKAITDGTWKPPPVREVK
jgi:hypothetical protein